MIQINPLQRYIDGGARAAITTPPSASLVFDLPGRAIWVKGVKLKGTDHTYTFSHDNYISLTNTPGSNESEDIKIGINTTLLKQAIDTTYGIVNATTNGLAPMFSSANKATAAAATTYNFLGIAGTTLKWYSLPWRNVRINAETSDKLGVNDTDPLIISQGTGISVTWDSSGKKIVITNTAPDQNHNTDSSVAQTRTVLNKDYPLILKGSADSTGIIAGVNFNESITYNPSTLRLLINGQKVVTVADVYVGATASAAATSGLVPAATSAQRNYFLRGDGTWANIATEMAAANTWRPIKVNSSEKLGSGTDTGAVDFVAGTGITLGWDATNKKITITNSAPDLNHNTDRTGIYKSTVSGTKKTDTTLIVANTSSGLIFEGGTNLFKIGDGTNYIEVPITPAFTVTDKSASILSSLTTLATIAGTDIKAKITVVDSSPTLTTSLKTIATIAGVEIKAKITNYNTDEKVRQVPKTDNTNRPLMMINGGTSLGEQVNTSMFSTGIYANASTKIITANGFVKTGSDDSHVLLGDGTHKALSDFSMSGHNHNDLYVSSLTTSGNYLRWVKNGTNNDLTIPYASTSDLAYWVWVDYCRGDSSASNSGEWSRVKNTISATGRITGRAKFYTVYKDGGPTNYGEVLEICSRNSNHWQPQLWFGSGKGGHLYYRNKNNNDDTWGDWATILDSNNYTSYINGQFWANVNISSSSSVITLPTFGSVIIGNVTTTNPSLVNVLTIRNDSYSSLVANNNTDWDDSISAYGISFDRYWNGYNDSNAAGIYAFGGGSWSTGLVFRTKSKTKGGLHNITSLILRGNGKVVAPYGFIGDLTGNADTATSATTATNANNALLTNTVTNTEYPLIFGSSWTTGNDYLALRKGIVSTTGANNPLRVCPGVNPAANTEGNAYIVLGNNLAKSAANNRTGSIYLYGAGAYWGRLIPTAVTANRTYTFPNGSGWVAIGATAGVGSVTQPVYLSDGGILTACTAYTGLLTAFSGGTISSSANTLTQTNHSITVGGTTKTAGSSTATIINTNVLSGGALTSSANTMSLSKSTSTINGVAASNSASSATIINSLSVSTLTSTAVTNLSVGITINGKASTTATLTNLCANTIKVTQDISSNAAYPVAWVSPANTTILQSSIYKSHDKFTFNPKTFLLIVSGNATVGSLTSGSSIIMNNEYFYMRRPISTNADTSVQTADNRIYAKLGTDGETYGIRFYSQYDPSTTHTSYTTYFYGGYGTLSYTQVAADTLGYQILTLGGSRKITTTNSCAGMLRLYTTQPADSTATVRYGSITPEHLTANRTYHLPNANGTIALVTDITNSYWANVKVSSSSSNETTPRFLRIGLGTAVNSSYSLAASGNCLAAHYYETSDARLKHDILPISKSIKQFKFHNDDRLYYGFIAQELEELHPELVDNSGEYKTVNYNSAICYYIGLLENRVKELEDKLKKYEEIQNI